MTTIVADNSLSPNTTDKNSKFQCFIQITEDRNVLHQYLNITICSTKERKNGKSSIVNVLWQLCDNTTWCSSPFAGIWPGSKLQTQLSYNGPCGVMFLAVRQVPNYTASR